MRKYVKRALGIVFICVLVFAFNTIAFAADDSHSTEVNAFYDESAFTVKSTNVKEETKFCDELSLVSPRTPSNLGWYTVTAYPCNINEHIYYSGYSESYYNPYGGGQSAALKVSQATYDCFMRNKCNGWYIVGEANVKGVSRAEIDANGTIYTYSGLSNLYSRYTFKFELPIRGNEDRAPFVLYGYDSSSRPAYINGWFEY